MLLLIYFVAQMLIALLYLNHLLRKPWRDVVDVLYTVFWLLMFGMAAGFFVYYGTN